MINYTMKWKSQPAILADDAQHRCAQVYVWLTTEDDQIAIVSKDAIKWQFPGGKPEEGESLIETAIREVYEETGLSIADNSQQLTFLGYYLVEETEDDRVIDTYLQVRYVLKLPSTADTYSLHTDTEDTVQDSTEMVQYAEFVDSHELLRRIEWMAKSPEYQAFLSMVG